MALHQAKLPHGDRRLVCPKLIGTPIQGQRTLSPIKIKHFTLLLFFSIALGINHVRHARVSSSMHYVNIAIIVYFKRHPGMLRCMGQ